MNIPSFQIETDRLVLRPLTFEDCENLYLLHSNPLVQKYTGEKIPANLATVQTLFNENTLNDYRTYGYGRCGVFLKQDGSFIGWSGLKYLPEFDLTDLGYRFHPQYWGKGYATESGIRMIEFGFDELNLSKVVAIAEQENPASIRVMQKCGMSFWKMAPYDPGGPNVVWYEKLNPSF